MHSSNAWLAQIGQRPDSQDGGWYWLAGGIAVVVALVSVIVVAWLADNRAISVREQGKSYRLSTRRFVAVGFLVGVVAVVGSFFLSLTLSPLAPDRVPAWTARVERWAADTYGVQAGADGFGRGNAVDCVAPNTGPCYQATLLLPGRVEKVQLAFPNAIPTLVSAGTGQPLAKAAAAESDRPLRLSSKSLAKDLARRYGLPGSIDVESWSASGELSTHGPGTLSVWSMLGLRGSACPADAGGCATGTILGRDGALHPAALVSVDGGAHGILVDPATGVEFPRAGSAS